MAGERDLATLLRGIEPELQDGTFVFCSIAPGEEIPAASSPLLVFREREGSTLVMRQEEAERLRLHYAFVSRLLTLTVHSSLDAVGFLAAVTNCLARAGISVNAVSAFYHDHLLVPEDRAEEALRLLRTLSVP